MTTVSASVSSAPPSAPARPLKRSPVYPKAVSGVIRQAKWAILIVCLAIYYVVPWIRWDRGAGKPHQAVLFDLASQRFYIFSIELWPQDIWLLVVAMIAAAIALFLVSSIVGRVWCGYACPQTIWTDLFMLVERRIEGDRNARMKRDAKPLTFDKAWRKIAKDLAWVVIAFWTGGAVTMYFANAPTIVETFWTGNADSNVYIATALLTAATYFMAGWTRSEYFCSYMCPWPRFQFAMSDEQTMSVTYRTWRGEPRGKGKAVRGNLGDCIDCASCVHVCPVGIDIRDGLQGECINCGLCMDACNHVMARTGRDPWLISWDSTANLQARTEGKPPVPFRFKRTRTVFYTVALVALSLFMAGALVERPLLKIVAEHDRAPLYVPLPGGGVRNAYTLHIANKVADAGNIRLTVHGIPGAVLSTEAQRANASDALLLPVPADDNGEFRVFVTIPSQAAVSTGSISLTAERLSDRAKAETSAVFMTGHKL